MLLMSLFRRALVFKQIQQISGLTPDAWRKSPSELRGGGCGGCGCVDTKAEVDADADTDGDAPHISQEGKSAWFSKVQVGQDHEGMVDNIKLAIMQ